MVQKTRMNVTRALALSKQQHNREHKINVTSALALPTPRVIVSGTVEGAALRIRLATVEVHARIVETPCGRAIDNVVKVGVARSVCGTHIVDSTTIGVFTRLQCAGNELDVRRDVVPVVRTL
jgi:hypothetical protein